MLTREMGGERERECARSTIFLERCGGEVGGGGVRRSSLRHRDREGLVERERVLRSFLIQREREVGGGGAHTLKHWFTTSFLLAEGRCRKARLRGVSRAQTE